MSKFALISQMERLAIMNRLLQGISSEITSLPTMIVMQQHGTDPRFEEYNQNQRRLMDQELQIMRRSVEGIEQVLDTIEEYINKQRAPMYRCTHKNLRNRIGNAEICLHDHLRGSVDQEQVSSLFRRIKELERRAEQIPTTDIFDSDDINVRKLIRDDPPPVRRVSEYEGSRSSSDEDCVICMDSMQSGDVWELKCHHKFHKKCVDMWLREHGTCPMCRAPI